jgi:uncharacterized protein YndB with AHSA1/START domain
MTNSTTITATPGLPFVDIEREFDAPAAAVFRAHVQADLYARWTGPRSMRLEDVELDARPGGRWMFSFRGGDAPELMSFFGVFHAVEPDRLLIQTFEFSLAPTQAGLSTTRFEALGGRTRLSVREVYPSVEVRDAAVASGMNEGIVEGYERLDELLAAAAVSA